MSPHFLRPSSLHALLPGCHPTSGFCYAWSQNPGIDSQTEPRPAVAAPQEKSEEEAGAGDGNLFEGDVLDMVLPASLAPASNTQKGTTIQTLDRDLPWMMSAHHITSPVLRLHNGTPFCCACG